jgi:sulfotransferase
MTVSERTKYWLSQAPVGLAVQRLHDVFQRRIDSNILFVRYEDLCSDPTLALEKIYDFVEENYFNHDFDNIQKTVEENDSYFGPYGNHSVNSVLQHSKNNWQEILPREATQFIQQQFNWYFKQFNYVPA